MKAAVIRFPGSNCDMDAVRTLQDRFGIPTDIIWHRNSFENEYDLVVLPGGFSYGDYLRTGAMARFANAMDSVLEHIKKGGKVLGICNGFQILTEAGILPGALTRNKNLKYICKTVGLRPESKNRMFESIQTRDLQIPIAHAEGAYFADRDTLQKLRDENRIVVRYTENPNGSLEDIAGISSADGRVVGMMPHPERACDPVTGRTDGMEFLRAFLEF